jgi:hypothetical protein
MERKDSCPAVSQICSLIFLSASSMTDDPNSMPIVVSVAAKSDVVNLSKRHDLPTPESPTRRLVRLYQLPDIYLNKKS